MRCTRLSFHIALSLIAICGSAASALALDVDLDPARIFVGYKAPNNVDSGPIRLADIANSPSHPLLLPCNVTAYGPQVDLRYLTDGPTLYPQLQSRFSVLPSTPISSTGYSGTSAPFTVLRSNLIAMHPFETQTDGQPTIDALDPTIWDYVFQPGDLPANRTVRHFMHIQLFSDDGYSAEITDDNVVNNNKFVYVRRACP